MSYSDDFTEEGIDIDDIDEKLGNERYGAPRNSRVDFLYTTDAKRVRSRRCLWSIGGLVVASVAAFVVVIVIVLNGDSYSKEADIAELPTQGASPDADTPPEDSPVASPVEPLSTTEILLREKSRFGGIEFDNHATYQSKALAWLEDTPFTPNENKAISDEERLIQRFGLACIHFSTNQVSNTYTEAQFTGYDLPPWNRDDGWLDTEDECTWYAIVCNEQGYVTEINLTKNALTGSFPYEVSYLKGYLEVLNLDTNFFHNKDHDGHAFIKELQNLRLMSVRDTFMQYNGIPPHYGHLPRLKSLDISYVVYTGGTSNDFMDSIENPLSDLVFLDISGNSFNGPIPDSIVNLPNLTAFYAINSNVESDVSFVANMEKAIEVWLDENPGLTGRLPDNLDRIANLKSFAITECSLTGPIPTSMGNLVNLQQVWFYGNQLDGQIPSSLGSLLKLETFEVHNNDLTGVMPTQMCTNTITGVLQTLQADCPDEVQCECCSCCGSSCGREPSFGGRRQLWQPHVRKE